MCGQSTKQFVCPEQFVYGLELVVCGRELFVGTSSTKHACVMSRLVVKWLELWSEFLIMV
jgi:hypothetical protein